MSEITMGENSMSDKIEPATDEQVQLASNLLFGRDKDLGGYSFKDKTVYQFIARITQLQSENAALRLLCGEAKKPLALLDGWEALAEKLDRALKGEL